MNPSAWQMTRGDGIAFAARDDVGLMVWSAPATLERGQWLTAQVLAWLDGRDGEVTVVQVILATSKPPDADTRAEARNFLALLAPRLRQLITLPIGNELWTVLVRMVLRGLSLFDNSVPSVIVADVAAAVAAVDHVRPLDPRARAELHETLTQLVRVDLLLAERRAAL